MANLLRMWDEAVWTELLNTRKGDFNSLPHYKEQLRDVPQQFSLH
jgi:hypothetical protein